MSDWWLVVGMAGWMGGIGLLLVGGYGMDGWVESWDGSFALLVLRRLRRDSRFVTVGNRTGDSLCMPKRKMPSSISWK